jgi:hypothetical protein
VSGEGGETSVSGETRVSAGASVSGEILKVTSQVISDAKFQPTTCPLHDFIDIQCNRK